MIVAAAGTAVVPLNTWASRKLQKAAIDQREHIADGLLERAIGAEGEVRVRGHLVEWLPFLLLAQHDRNIGV
jgi:hypothetical protein